MAGSTRPHLSLPEYERIFQVIYSVLDGRARIAHACLFFSWVGTKILEQKHRIPARPVAGAAAYLADEKISHCVLLGRITNDALTSSRTAFHSWIESEGIVIDFLAPLFEDSLRDDGHQVTVPRRMFQKPRSEMAGNLNDLRREGDFLLVDNPSLTHELFDKFTQRPGQMDLANACLTWYEPYPTALRPMLLTNDLGESYPLRFTGPAITGAW